MPEEEAEQSLSQGVLAMDAVETLVQGIEPQSQVLHVVELVLVRVMVDRTHQVYFLDAIYDLLLLVLVCQSLLTGNVYLYEVLRVSFLFQDLILVCQIRIDLFAYLTVKLGQHGVILSESNVFNEFLHHISFFLLFLRLFLLLILSRFLRSLLQTLSQLLFDPE